MKPHVKLTWIIEDRLFFLKWPQSVDVEVVRDFTEQVVAAMEAGKAETIHYISDTRPMKGFPMMKDVRPILDSFKHPKMGWTISLGGFNPALKTMVHIVSGALGMKVRTVANVDEAIQFLKENDPTLPDLAPYKAMISTLADE
jgi:hypothetical protein